MKNNDISSKIAVAIIAAALGAGAMYGGLYLSSPEMFKYSKQTKAIADCEKILAEKGDPDFDKKAAEDGMINGYLHEGGDKYTTYYDIASGGSETEYMTSYVNTSGTAEASGFQIDIADDGNILITEVTSGLAAYKQGIREMDVIIAIDGVSVSETKYENIANKLLGKQDTKVTLTVRRDGKEFDIEFIRDHVYKNYVEHEIEQEFGILKINKFSQYGGGQYDQSVKALTDCKKIIIDLRNNPGGDGEVSMEWAARIGGEAQVTKNYYTGKTEELSTEGNGDFADKKIVLLVNEHTASAAEIFCANIVQNLDAVMVGANTFGKGVFQNYADLSDGGQLCYVAGSFTVGDWENWHGVGIAPDVEVKMDGSLIGTNDDVQLKKALELLE
ncbi:MAG: S41 family peptidase [Ruminococcus sp.]|nr:S41 family peptidase [Ruminococcus sp.]